MKKGIKNFIFSLFIFFVFVLFSQPIFVQAEQVEIWATSTAAWTTTFGNAGPVDNGTANNAITPQVAVAPNGMVYIVFAQYRGISNHIYLSRYDGTDVRIWDTGAKAWTTTFADGDPIDLDGLTGASAPQIAIDSNNIVYVTFVQNNGSAVSHIYLSRYDGTDVRIWDNNLPAWTLTLANGDPIDTGTANSVSAPQIAIDSTNQVYVTYIQTTGAVSHIFLSRYIGTNLVEIWNNDAPAGWTTTFTLGDSIDKGGVTSASAPQMVIDSTNKVYVTYSQIVGSDHIYLSRYDGTDVRIWDNDTASWILIFTNGDPIDTGTPNSASVPQIARDSSNNIYIAYIQYDGMNYHLYVSRYDGTDVRIWDNAGGGTWNSTFNTGDPVDLGTALHAQSPDMAIDSNNKVYLTYRQNNLVYLSRYDGTDFKIWDTAGWTNTFANGDSIDTGSGTSYIPQLAIDSSNNVYVTYRNSVAILYKLYLSRYNSTDARTQIWDNDTAAWTTILASGDGIDTGNISGINDPQIAKGASDNIYVTYPQSDGAQTHIYLSRYNATGTPSVIVLPTATSSAATGISTTTATLNGDITNTGGENNTVRGFEYGTTTAYGLSTSTTGTYGTGAFSFAITGLTASTTYHFRAFSTNSAGTGTSTDLTFETSATPPVITLPVATTSAATSITTTGATLHGNITATGGENNTIRGFEYGLTVAYGSVSSTTGSYSTGEYTVDISGLSTATTYHFRAFSTNSAGTGTSTDLTFTAGSSGGGGGGGRTIISPITLTATTPTNCGSLVDLSWSSYEGADGYKIYKNNEFLIATSSLSVQLVATSTDVFSVSGLSSNSEISGSLSNSVLVTPSLSCPFLPRGCQGVIPDMGYESCPGTHVSETATWTLVNSCPTVFVGTCQFRAVAGDDIVPPVVPPVNPPVVPPVNPPVNPPINPPVTPPGIQPPVIPGGTRPIISASTTEKLFTGAKLIFESQTGSTVTKLVATLGVLAGTLAATSVVDLLSLPFRLWGLLLSIFGLKKRNRPWGTVYDSITKQPIDPAYVTLKNITTNEENTSITDLDGRYGFLVTPGQYTLTANKTNYTFPSEKMRGQAEDVMYNNLYFGETLQIEGDNLLINKNIPIDPIKFDWNEFVKGKNKLMKFYSQREKVIRLITDWTFRVGFVVSIVSIFIVPAPYNLIIFSLYLLLAIARKFGLKFKALGALLEKDGSPLSFAIIRVFDAELKVQITNKVADKIGRYYCLVPKGKYFVKIEKKNDDESYSEIFTSDPFDASNGIIKKSFTV